MTQPKLLGLMLLALPFWWGEPVDLHLADVTPLEDVVGDDSVRNPLVAPDGSAIAWDDGDGVCVYRFESNETTCTPWPDRARLNTGRLNLPAWSPDGQRIIFHQDAFIRFLESDLWAYDVATARFSNLTDDGVESNAIMGDDNAGMTLDLGPFFSPTSGDLYFWRLAVEDETAPFRIGDAFLYLMKLNDDGDAEQVRLMSGDIPGPTSISSPGVFSQDGNTIYVTVFPPNWMSEPATGVYALDLRSGDFDVVAPLSRLAPALPEWANEAFVPTRAEPAGDGLVVWMEDTRGMSGLGFRVPVYLDLQTGEATSVIDYSGFADIGALEEVRDEPTIYDLIFGGGVIPGGQSVWLMQSHDDQTSVVEAPLPPGSAEPEILATIEVSRVTPLFEIPPTFGGDKLLLYNLLLTLEPDA